MRNLTLLELDFADFDPILPIFYTYVLSVRLIKYSKEEGNEQVYSA